MASREGGKPKGSSLKPNYFAPFAKAAKLSDQLRRTREIVVTEKVSETEVFRKTENKDTGRRQQL